MVPVRGSNAWLYNGNCKQPSQSNASLVVEEWNHINRKSHAFAGFVHIFNTERQELQEAGKQEYSNGAVWKNLPLNSQS